MRILLHVGMPKCGSSALQACWSSKAFEQAGRVARIGYAAVHENGKVWSGDELVESAAANVYGYLSSHGGKGLSAFNMLERARIRKSLLGLATKYDTLILSNEGWGPHALDWADDSLLASKDFDVTVLAYVRPQAEWMNSAWWQWGAWTDAPLPRWVNRNLAKVQWHDLLGQWQQKPWVRQVDVRLMQGDVVQDFMQYAGVKLAPQARTNQSLPASVLRLFQHHRELRPGPHDSAIEFVLARQLSLEQGRTPWVMRPALIEQLIAGCAEGNRQLMSMLPAEQQALMTADSRWWDPRSFDERELRPAMTKQLNLAELEGLAVAALQAISRLDEEVRKRRKAGTDTDDEATAPDADVDF